MEYLERKSACFVGMSGIQDQRSELIDKALEFCPAYSVVAKVRILFCNFSWIYENLLTQCVEICGTVSEKSRCILKGYHAIVNKVFLSFFVWEGAGESLSFFLSLSLQSAREPSLSLICVQLLLNHAYLHCVSGHLKLAVSFLKHSLGLENLDNNADENQMKPNSFFTGIYVPSMLHKFLSLLLHFVY